MDGRSEMFRDGPYLIYYTEFKALCVFREQITWPNYCTIDRPADGTCKYHGRTMVHGSS